MVTTLAVFSGWDWAVLVGYLLVTTCLGAVLAGRQRNLHDFFRGGNKLPWYAVSASMIATIISAVTFIGVPAIVYRDEGNFTYLQFGIIAGLLSRLFVALILVPAYYRYEIFSPYDYMGERLGELARSVTTALFSLMGLLAQSARVYLTAVILQLVLREQLAQLQEATNVSAFAWSVIAVGAVAVLWTLLGGIATVVWTDAMLFLVFVVGGLIALGVVIVELPGGLSQLLHDAKEAGKFQLWDLQWRADPDRWHETFTKPYTIWAAIFAVTFGNIGSYGTDQLLAQRIFCCKNAAHAKLAVLTSWAGELVVALMLLVGAGLWVFYQQFPQRLTGQAAEAVAEDLDKVFPAFILSQVPTGLVGLIVAGIFAAAISSMTSILAALSQTTLSAVFLPALKIDPHDLSQPGRQRTILRISRLLIVAWGVALCAMAFAVDRYVTAMRAAGEDVPFLDLALGLASYVVGALLAAFLLAWLPLKRNAYGLVWSAPLSIFTIFACRFHDQQLPSSVLDFLLSAPQTYWKLKLCGLVGLVLVITWLIAARLHHHRLRRPALLGKTVWLVAGCAVMIWATAFGWFHGGTEQVTAPDGETVDQTIKLSIAFPWYAPIGGAVALVFGYLLGEPRREGDGASGAADRRRQFRDYP